jgi:hypothetical protein
VIVAINNDDKNIELSFATNQREGIALHDRLGGARDVRVDGGKINLSLSKRSAAIFVRKDQ